MRLRYILFTLFFFWKICAFQDDPQNECGYSRIERNGIIHTFCQNYDGPIEWFHFEVIESKTRKFASYYPNEGKYYAAQCDIDSFDIKKETSNELARKTYWALKKRWDGKKH